MKKQILSFVLLFLPIIVSADNSGSCGENVMWSFEEATGTLTISGTGPMDDHMWYRDGMTGSDENNPFKEIGTNVEAVVINEGVTSIGGGAFVYCHNLVSISIPNSITNIGDLAFADCSKLSIISFPENINSIGSGAFQGCSGLKSIIIPKSLNTINHGTFQNCI